MVSFYYLRELWQKRWVMLRWNDRKKKKKQRSTIKYCKIVANYLLWHFYHLTNFCALEGNSQVQSSNTILLLCKFPLNSVRIANSVLVSKCFIQFYHHYIFTCMHFGVCEKDHFTSNTHDQKVTCQGWGPSHRHKWIKLLHNQYHHKSNVVIDNAGVPTNFWGNTKPRAQPNYSVSYHWGELGHIKTNCTKLVHTNMGQEELEHHGNKPIVNVPKMMLKFSFHVG